MDVLYIEQRSVHIYIYTYILTCILTCKIRILKLYLCFFLVVCIPASDLYYVVCYKYKRKEIQINSIRVLLINVVLIKAYI